VEENDHVPFTRDFLPTDSSIHFPAKADRSNHICITRTASVLGAFVVDPSLGDHPLRRFIGLGRINKQSLNLCLESRTQDVDVDIWLTEANIRRDAKEPTWIRLAAQAGNVTVKLVCFASLFVLPVSLTVRPIARAHLQTHSVHAAGDLWIFAFYQYLSSTLIHRRS